MYDFFLNYKIIKVFVCEFEINYILEVLVLIGSIERKYKLKIVYFYKLDKIKNIFSIFCLDKVNVN